MTYIKSRTILTVVFMFLLGGFQAVEEVLTPEMFLLVEGVLTALVVYFRSHPKQEFSKN